MTKTLTPIAWIACSLLSAAPDGKPWHHVPETEIQTGAYFCTGSTPLLRFRHSFYLYLYEDLMWQTAAYLPVGEFGKETPRQTLKTSSGGFRVAQGRLVLESAPTVDVAVEVSPGISRFEGSKLSQEIAPDAGPNLPGGLRVGTFRCSPDSPLPGPGYSPPRFDASKSLISMPGTFRLNGRYGPFYFSPNGFVSPVGPCDTWFKRLSSGCVFYDMDEGVLKLSDALSFPEWLDFKTRNEIGWPQRVRIRPGETLTGQALVLRGAPSLPYEPDPEIPRQRLSYRAMPGNLLHEGFPIPVVPPGSLIPHSQATRLEKPGEKRVDAIFADVPYQPQGVPNGKFWLIGWDFQANGFVAPVLSTDGRLSRVACRTEAEQQINGCRYYNIDTGFLESNYHTLTNRYVRWDGEVFRGRLGEFRRVRDSAAMPIAEPPRVLLDRPGVKRLSGTYAIPSMEAQRSTFHPNGYVTRASGTPDETRCDTAADRQLNSCAFYDLDNGYRDNSAPTWLRRIEIRGETLALDPHIYTAVPAVKQ